MPRNQNVYGKRRKAASAFVPAGKYSWSPGKPALLADELRKDEGDPASLVTEKLAKLSVTDNQHNIVSSWKDSKALKPSDGNIIKGTGTTSDLENTSKAAKAQDCRQTTATQVTNTKGSLSQIENPKSAIGKTLSISDEKKVTSSQEHCTSPEVFQIHSQHSKTTKPRERKLENHSRGKRPRLPSKCPNSPPVHRKGEQVTHTKAENRSTDSLPLPYPTASARFSDYTAPLLDLCSDPQGCHSPTLFGTWSSTIETHLHITKIAEASYGEVYRLSPKSHISGFTKSDESVLKVIALKPPGPAPVGRNGRVDKRHAEKTSMMSAVDNVVSEVLLMQRMTSIPGFTNFREVRVLQGRPSKAFAEAWKAFNKTRPRGEKSIFPDPSRKGSYDEEQLWAVIEMQDAGTDLENVIISDVWGVWDVFWGVALALGKGEEGARFEHRDLHLGNICVKLANTSTPTSQYCVRNTQNKLGFTDLETTIIDYTLSRAEMGSNPEDSSLSVEERVVAYLDLEKDPAIFEGDGDEEYQYEIYRYMRAAMYVSDPHADLSTRSEEIAASDRTWRGFHPQTNVIWLHFVLVKLLECIEWPSASLTNALSRVADPAERERAVRRAKWLEKTLLELQELFDLKNFQRSGVASVRELVGLALARGWLNECDVIGASISSAESSLVSNDSGRTSSPSSDG